MKRLEEGGFIKREYRDYEFSGMKMTNVTYVEPVAKRILEITHPESEPFEPEPSPGDDRKQDAEPVSGGGVSIPHPPLQDQGPERLPDLLKIITKTSTKITTTTEVHPSSENLSTNESGSGNDLIYPKEFSPAEKEAATKILKAVNGQAQELLDELAGQLKAKEIKNPLDYLRGLIAKAKEGKFSATAGIKVEESRRRRASIEASIKASEERANRQLEELRRKGVGKRLDEPKSLGATAYL